MTDGPQATEEPQRFNPVVEALSALRELERIRSTVHLETDTRVQALAALTVGWSLLASVSGGATINLGERSQDGPDDGGVNALEQQAKAAFGG